MRSKRRRKNNATLPIVLFTLVLVLSIGGLALAQTQRQARIANPGKVNSQDEVPRLTVSEAYQAVLNGEAVLIDVRGQTQFNEQRASGAINIPITEFEARIGELDPDTWYITYCT